MKSWWNFDWFFSLCFSANHFLYCIVLSRLWRSICQLTNVFLSLLRKRWVSIEKKLLNTHSVSSSNIALNLINQRHSRTFQTQYIPIDSKLASKSYESMNRVNGVMAEFLKQHRLSHSGKSADTFFFFCWISIRKTHYLDRSRHFPNGARIESQLNAWLHFQWQLHFNTYVL